MPPAISGDFRHFSPAPQQSPRIGDDFVFNLNRRDVRLTPRWLRTVSRRVFTRRGPEFVAYLKRPKGGESSAAAQAGAAAAAQAAKQFEGEGHA